MSECFYCAYCFRDDNYGECCLCENSDYYTRSWDLDWRIITNCKYFDDIRNNGCYFDDEQQATIKNQEQKIKILQQEINDTQAILEMLTEKLKGWNNG